MSDRLLKFMVDDAGRLGSSQTTSCVVFTNQQAFIACCLTYLIHARDMVSNFMKVMMSNSSEALVRITSIIKIIAVLQKQHGYLFNIT